MPSGEVVLQNPYGVAPDAFRKAQAELLEASRAQLGRWISRGSPHDVALAWAHAHALEGMGHGALVEAPFLSDRRLKLSEPDKARLCAVALASARCVQATERLYGTSREMHQVRHDIWAACFGRTLLHGLLLQRVVRDHDVLIVGETGTGKELVAGAIASGLTAAGHLAAPFAQINAAAVPDTLVESELFGHTKGAFTGATATRVGLIRSADGGAMFLDEVGDLPPLTQAKLLRVIETDQVQPVGSDKLHRVDVRFVAATHHDLSVRVREGGFRADLYQRLAGVVIRTPALRERPQDIAVIGEQFVSRMLDGVDGLDPSRLLRWLKSPAARSYAWPGNVRELRNVLRNLVLGLDAGLEGQPPASIPQEPKIPPAIAALEASLAEVEAWYIKRAVARTHGNLAAAARILGLDRTTVARKLRD